jgi:integrase
MAWKNVSKGVRYREHESRKHNKRPDRYYMLTYKRGGKTMNEALGWASDGFTQADAEDLMETLRKNWRSGTGVQSLREMREHEADKRDQSVAARKEQERKGIPLADYWAAAYLPHAQRTKKDTSWGKEEQHFRVWLDPNFGSLPLTKFGMPQWDSLMRTLHKAGLSQRSREYISGTLRRILRHAQDRGLPVVVPTGKQIGATAPRNNRRQRVLTPAEKELLLLALAERDVNAWRVAQFAMLTGYRLSEALRLRWAQVDLVAASVRFVDTKNKDSRAVPLAQPLRRCSRACEARPSTRMPLSSRTASARPGPQCPRPSRSWSAPSPLMTGLGPWTGQASILLGTPWRLSSLGTRHPFLDGLHGLAACRNGGALYPRQQRGPESCRQPA